MDAETFHFPGAVDIDHPEPATNFERPSRHRWRTSIRGEGQTVVERT